MSYIKYGLAGIGIFAGLVGLGFALTGVDLAQYAFWAPKYKAVERQVFEESKPYVQGKITVRHGMPGSSVLHFSA